MTETKLFDWVQRSMPESRIADPSEMLQAARPLMYGAEPVNWYESKSEAAISCEAKIKLQEVDGEWYLMVKSYNPRGESTRPRWQKRWKLTGDAFSMWCALLSGGPALWQQGQHHQQPEQGS